MRSSIPLRRVSARAAALAVAGLTIAACGSGGSGGGNAGPSQSEILNKLKSDTTVSGQLGQLSSNAKFKNEAYTCIAKVIHDDVDASDAQAYVDGKKSVKQLDKGTSDSELTADLKKCITSKIKGSS